MASGILVYSQECKLLIFQQLKQNETKAYMLRQGGKIAIQGGK